jgi:hypothetical protein
MIRILSEQAARMTRSHWKPPKDPAEQRHRRERELELAEIVDYGTEEDFIAAVKCYNPEVGREELRDLIMRFRAAVREKRGLL